MKDNEQPRTVMPVGANAAADCTNASEPPAAGMPENDVLRKRGVRWYAGHILLYTMIPAASLILAIVHSTKVQKDGHIRTLARACLIVDGVLLALLALNILLINLITVMTMYMTTTSFFGG
jgi:hypothetical protein